MKSRENVKEQVCSFDGNFLTDRFYFCLKLILISGQKNFDLNLFYQLGESGFFKRDYKNKISFSCVIGEIFALLIGARTAWSQALKEEFENSLVGLATKSKWSQETRLMAVQLIFFMNQNHFFIKRPIIKETGEFNNWNFSREQMFRIYSSNEDSQNSLIQIIARDFVS